MRGAVVLALMVAGCAVTPPKPPEPRTTVVEVPTPIAVPCFKESERPQAPKPTPINLDTATLKQMAGAELADALAWEAYRDAVDKLFLKCSTLPEVSK